MKKIALLSIICAMLFSSNLMAQGPYIKIKAGYAVPILKLPTGVELNGTDVLYNSFGHGIPLSLTVGSTIEKHWGVEMDLTYQIGLENDINEVGASVKGKGSQFRIAPSLVVFTGYEGMDFHARFGTALGLATNYKYESYVVGGAFTESTGKGYFSMGFVSAFGFTFNLADNLYFLGEMEVLSMMVKDKEYRDPSGVTTYDSDVADKSSVSGLSFNAGFKYGF